MTIKVQANPWEQYVRDLYMRSDMDIGEFEALLDTAMRGNRPEHPDLPLFSPFKTEVVQR